jgi:hypothetical protein
VTWHPTAGIVKWAQTSIARQRLAKYFPERYENKGPLMGNMFGCHDIASVSGKTHSWNTVMETLEVVWSIFEIQTASESSRGLGTEDGLVKQTLNNSFRVCYTVLNSNPQRVIITCTYDLCICNKSIYQSIPFYNVLIHVTILTLKLRPTEWHNFN